MAASISAEDVEQLRAQGIEVHGLQGKPSLRDMAAAALELRKAHPRARLVVAGPEGLVRQLERRYPPLVDVALTSSSSAAVMAALE